MAGAGRDVGLNTDDGLNLMLFARFIKLNSAIEIAVVGEPERGHPAFFSAGDEIGYFGKPVK